jgi:Kinesin motor domain
MIAACSVDARVLAHVFMVLGKGRGQVEPLEAQKRETFVFRTTDSIMYAVVGKPLIASVVRGRNATCVTYGAAGSGKSHTMVGAQQRSYTVSGDRNVTYLERQQVHLDDTEGLMPRMLNHLFHVCSTYFSIPQLHHVATSKT